MKALIKVKNTYKFRSGYAIAVSSIRKYPVLKDALLSRIDSLMSRYDLEQEYKVFDLAQGPLNAKQALKDQGGIYILHNKTTGLFYVGSAQRFFSKGGRLNDYYMKGRVSLSLRRKSTKVSYQLAELIDKHGMKDFTLIVLPLSLENVRLNLKGTEQECY